ncbi:MAG: signal peptidase I [Chloroflexi bacterium]|nr:signal peptidase I [Chloroflexota bacterium]
MDSFRTEIIPEQTPKKHRSGCFNFAVDTLETVLLALILFFGINAVSARVRVENISMEPTLMPGEFMLIDKIAYKIGKPQTGDIIVFHYPRNPSEDFVKRVIGLPGETVKVANGVVSINGKALVEPYIAAPPQYTGTWTVPANSLFVLGDNRNQSSDSHSWGFVPMYDVVGKALFIYWPPEDFQVIDHPDIVNAAR